MNSPSNDLLSDLEKYITADDQPLLTKEAKAIEDTLALYAIPSFQDFYSVLPPKLSEILLGNLGKIIYLMQKINDQRGEMHNQMIQYKNNIDLLEKENNKLKHKVVNLNEKNERFHNTLIEKDKQIKELKKTIEDANNTIKETTKKTLIKDKYLLNEINKKNTLYNELEEYLKKQTEKLKTSFAQNDHYFEMSYCLTAKENTIAITKPTKEDLINNFCIDVERRSQPIIKENELLKNALIDIHKTIIDISINQMEHFLKTYKETFGYEFEAKGFDVAIKTDALYDTNEILIEMIKSNLSKLKVFSNTNSKLCQNEGDKMTMNGNKEDQFNSSSNSLELKYMNSFMKLYDYSKEMNKYSNEMIKIALNNPEVLRKSKSLNHQEKMVKINKEMKEIERSFTDEKIPQEQKSTNKTFMLLQTDLKQYNDMINNFNDFITHNSFDKINKYTETLLTNGDVTMESL